MIELGMVHRMIRSALVASPFLLLALWSWGGGEAAFSGVVGLLMALANLWLAGRIIGGVADNNPHLLLGAALLAFALGLGALTAVALALQAADLVSFRITGLTLVGAHLVLVLWEGARAHPVRATVRDDALKVRS